MMELKGKEDKAWSLHKPARKGDIAISGANIAKIKKELGFKSKYTIGQGLKLMN